MKIRPPLHSWQVTPQQAIELQNTLASRILREVRPSPEPRYIAGSDISGEDNEGFTIGAVVVLSFPGLELVEVKRARVKPTFPYVPGLLSFRESPVVLAAMERLTLEPDVLMVDGQGIAHPRRFGIACHLGLLLDIPTIGCAKSILVGKYRDLDEKAGSTADLVDKEVVVGAAVRTRDGTSPVFVSVGHKIGLASAIGLTLACCKGYRIPEPTRLAHQAAALRLEEKEPPAGRARKSKT